MVIFDTFSLKKVICYTFCGVFWIVLSFSRIGYGITMPIFGFILSASRATNDLGN